MEGGGGGAGLGWSGLGEWGREGEGYLRVRTRSLAWILQAPIWPSLALFLICWISFRSWFSSLIRSRSSSRWVFSRARWCFRRRSWGVMRFPKAHSMIWRRVSGGWWWMRCGRGVGGDLRSSCLEAVGGDRAKELGVAVVELERVISCKST